MSDNPMSERRPVRYTAMVTAIPQNVGRWTARLELTDDTDAIVQSVDIDAIMFLSREEAEAAGWKLVDAWLRRFTEIA